MVDIKHGELKAIVLKHAETVKRDALFVSNRLVDANDVAKSIQKNLQCCRGRMESIPRCFGARTAAI